MNSKLGLIHIYCGDGKGKTTAAFGLALRAAGRGFSIYIAQFLKSSETGELQTISSLSNISIIRSKKKFPFSFNMNDYQKAEITNIHNMIFDEAVSRCDEKQCDVLILDEIIAAYNYGYIDKLKVDSFLENPPENVEIILTGRNPSQKFIQIADYVSEIKKIKHPFDKGISAREGIEM